MFQAKDFDDDGFELRFEDDITDEEKEYYIRAYPNVNMIADRRVHCTSCDGHIGTAPASEKIIRMHPVLCVTNCKECDESYKQVDFDKEDGGRYCQWCAQRGQTIRCSKCANGFCKKCILRNFSHATLQIIKNNQYWDCFACAPDTILPLRAQYWALWNFFAKQTLMIEKQAKAGRCYVEIMNALNHDSSTCCPYLYQANKAMELDDASGISSDSTEEEEWRSVRKRKRRRIESSENSLDAGQKSPPPCLKRLNNVAAESIDDSNSIELVNDGHQSSTTVPSPVITGNELCRNLGHREEFQPVAAATRTHTFLVSVTTTNNEPIYHTINGHRIELNSAAQQTAEGNVITADGKIIYVRKLATIPNAVPAPPISQPIQIQHEIEQQRTQFQSLMSANPSQACQQFTASSALYATIGPRKYSEGPVGDACTQFERQIYNGLEICQNTEVKLKTFMNSNAYKTVRNVNDIKELQIHMSYLLTFTLGRFKTLQDQCIDDLRKLGFHTEADSLSKGKIIKKYNSESDVNDVEIVEPKHATINLDDSDDEQPEGNKGDIDATTSWSPASISDSKKRQKKERDTDTVDSSAETSRCETDVMPMQVVRDAEAHDDSPSKSQPLIDNEAPIDLKPLDTEVPRDKRSVVGRTIFDRAKDSDIEKSLKKISSLNAPIQVHGNRQENNGSENKPD